MKKIDPIVESYLTEGGGFLSGTKKKIFDDYSNEIRRGLERFHALTKPGAQMHRYSAESGADESHVQNMHELLSKALDYHDEMHRYGHPEWGEELKRMGEEDDARKKKAEDAKKFGLA